MQPHCSVWWWAIVFQTNTNVDMLGMSPGASRAFHSPGVAPYHVAYSLPTPACAVYHTPVGERCLVAWKDISEYAALIPLYTTYSLMATTDGDVARIGIISAVTWRRQT